MKSALDLVVKNVQVVRPNRPATDRLDLGVRDGRFARIAPEIPAGEAREVYDARGLLGFPGLVDAHTHVGIYAPLAEDAVTESKAAAMGGVTTMLTYFRTGQYYLNRGGPYAELFPEVLKLSEGRYRVDYAYHLAPIQSRHLDEMDALAARHGVPSFKIFMFYGGYGLHGRTDLEAQRRFLTLDDGDSYDLAHFEFVLRAAARIGQSHPELAQHVSVSVHCEVADILNAYTRLVQRDRRLSGLRAYSAARPPHSEGLGVWIVSYLAHEAGCANVNLLHLSSRTALEAALAAAQAFPHVDFRREVTVGHLLLDYDTPAGAHAKVNPPIRSREDVEFLWRAVLDRQIDWIVSDHACCARELKVAADRPDDVWLARAGFGGTEYLLPGIFSEGSKRGMTYSQMAELTSWNPARRYGLGTKESVSYEGAPHSFYHLTDPIVALRLLYHALRRGGVLCLESMAIDSDRPICEYAGQSQQGRNWFIPSPPALARWIEDTGFEGAQVGNGLAPFAVTNAVDPMGAGRCFAVARRRSEHRFTFRVGLSVDVP